MPTIERLSGREVLDSRGRPTVLATCVLEGGISASASVPSGASTGSAAAFELRDGDPKRYQGLGCRRAAANIGGVLQDALAGRVFSEQTALDRAMIALDGTSTKSSIGANAILAVSVAFARAHAMERGVPLFQHFAHMMGSAVTTLPRLTINLFSGGKHAGQQVSVQDVLIIPMSAQTIDEALVSAFDSAAASFSSTSQSGNSRLGETLAFE
jgi:enolase